MEILCTERKTTCLQRITSETISLSSAVCATLAILKTKNVALLNYKSNNKFFQGIANKELSQMDIYTSVVPKRLEIQSEAVF